MTTSSQTHSLRHLRQHARRHCRGPQRAKASAPFCSATIDAPCSATCAQRFPDAELVEDAAAARTATLARVARFVDSPAAGIDLPLDVGRHGIPAARLARAHENSGGNHRELRRHRARDRRAEIRARGGAGLRRKRAGARDPLPSRRAQRRRVVRLSLGSDAQARVAGTRSGAMSAAAWHGRCAGGARRRSGSPRSIGGASARSSTRRAAPSSRNC